MLPHEWYGTSDSVHAGDTTAGGGVRGRLHAWLSSAHAVELWRRKRGADAALPPEFVVAAT